MTLAPASITFEPIARPDGWSGTEDAGAMTAEGRLIILVVARGVIGADEIQALARRTMPPWLQPAVVAVRAAIPALVTGKHDREACIRLLETELGAAPDAPWTRRAR